MSESISCGGVVFHHGKILLLYKNQHNKNKGWVMPKGTVEDGETFEETALREVFEEAGVEGKIIEYVGETSYTFRGYEGPVKKTVHWYLMTSDSFKCTPQAEEHFVDVGYYKHHEATHLVKFHDERDIMLKAIDMMQERLIKRNQFFNNTKAKHKK